MWLKVELRNDRGYLHCILWRSMCTLLICRLNDRFIFIYNYVQTVMTCRKVGNYQNFREFLSDKDSPRIKHASKK